MCTNMDESVNVLLFLTIGIKLRKARGVKLGTRNCGKSQDARQW